MEQTQIQQLVEPTLENFRKDVVGLSAFAKLVAYNYRARNPLTANVTASFAKLLDSYASRNELR